MQINHTASPTRSSSEAELPPVDGSRRPLAEDRWEWIEHIVPISFLRVLWNGLRPSRFRVLVLEALDGTPPQGYARPLTFCMGCWLLFFAAAQAFPWAFSTVGLNPILTSLPAADRQAVARQLGIDTIIAIRDTGNVTFGNAGLRAVDRVHHLTGKRFGRPTPSDIAQYLETKGDTALAVRVRGYALRQDERPTPFGETTLVFFVVFGLVPGWWVSHKILASRKRTVVETRYVHMYNDSWFVVFVLLPLSIATWAGTAFATRVPQRMLLAIAAAGLLTWIVRTPMLFRATHDAPRWRVAAAHLAGFTVAVAMAAAFAILSTIVTVTIMRSGF
jgi:hypothetical protein